MPNLITNKTGFLRFAAISGITSARPEDLVLFYRDLLDLGVTKVLRIENGGPLVETMHSSASSAVLGAIDTPPRYAGTGAPIKLIHGASGRPVDLFTYSGRLNKITLASRVEEHRATAGDGHSEIILLGGERRRGDRASACYFHKEATRKPDATHGSAVAARPGDGYSPLCFAATVGVFTDIEVQLDSDGTLVECVVRYWDLSNNSNLP